MGGRGTRTTTVRVRVTVQYEEGEGEGWRGRGRGKKTLHYPVLCQASSRLRVFELVEPPSTSKEQREYLTGALVHMYACPWRNVTSAASWNWPVVQVTLQQMQCKADSRELVSKLAALDYMSCTGWTHAQTNTKGKGAADSDTAQAASPPHSVLLFHLFSPWAITLPAQPTSPKLPSPPVPPV